MTTTTSTSPAPSATADQPTFRDKANALAARTAAYAKAIRLFSGSVPKTLATVDDLKQLIRSSGSVGANYLEADEAMSKRDFIKCMKICRKEARECMFWLRQLDPSLPDDLKDECRRLGNEAYALLRIFTASIGTASQNLHKKK